MVARGLKESLNCGEIWLSQESRAPPPPSYTRRAAAVHECGPGTFETSTDVRDMAAFGGKRTSLGDCGKSRLWIRGLIRSMVERSETIAVSSVRMLGRAAMIAVLLAPTASIARHDDHRTEARRLRWFNVAASSGQRRADDTPAPVHQCDGVRPPPGSRQSRRARGNSGRSCVPHSGGDFRGVERRYAAACRKADTARRQRKRTSLHRRRSVRCP
jgi:hypothetical protein